MKTIQMWTDGACKGNPGPGGWCVHLRDEVDYEIPYCKTFSGNKVHTTNNEMEITAVLQGFNRLQIPCNVTVYSDSAWIINGATKWISDWVRNGWKTNSGKPIAYVDEWQKIYYLMQIHNVQWIKIKAHSGNILNEYVDKMASEEASKLNGMT